MVALCELYKKERQVQVLHLRQIGGGVRVTLRTLHPEVSRRVTPLFSRGELQSAVLQLQYKFGGESIYLRPKTRGGKGKEAFRLKRKGTQSRRKLVSGKDKRV